MTFQGDPYRTLGVAPGASLNEIRSAYRRLAKTLPPGHGRRTRPAAVPRRSGPPTSSWWMRTGGCARRDLGRRRGSADGPGAVARRPGQGPGLARRLAGAAGRAAGAGASTGGTTARAAGAAARVGQARTARPDRAAGRRRAARARAAVSGTITGAGRARPPPAPPRTTRRQRPRSTPSGTAAPGTARRRAPTGPSTRVSTRIPASTAPSTCARARRRTGARGAAAVPGEPAARPQDASGGPDPATAAGGAAGRWRWERHGRHRHGRRCRGVGDPRLGVRRPG